MGIAGISTPAGEGQHEGHRAGRGMWPRGEWDSVQVGLAYLENSKEPMK